MKWKDNNTTTNLPKEPLTKTLRQKAEPKYKDILEKNLL